MVFGYNVKDEAKEIGTELKGSRNALIIGIVSFVVGAIGSGQIKKYFNRDNEEEDYGQ